MFTFASTPDERLPIFSTGMIGQYVHGNEPSHHVAYLYNFTAHPEKASERVGEIFAHPIPQYPRWTLRQ